MIEIYGSLDGRPQQTHYIVASDVRVLSETTGRFSSIVHLKGGKEIMSSEPVKTLVKRVQDETSERYIVSQPKDNKGGKFNGI